MDVPFQASAAPLVNARPVANFHPSIWGDHFLAYNSNLMAADRAYKENLVKELKEQVRKEFKAIASRPIPLLQLIDAIQRLGVEYHFEVEIEQALQHMFDTYHNWEENNDMYSAALYFRILRQHGFNVSCEIFKNFKADAKGNFKETLIDDVQGMLAFYEAIYLRVHGDDLLDDEALAFTTIHLQSILANLGNPLDEQVKHALKQPLRRGMTRLEARNYISIYEQDASHNKALLKLAKLDFNLLQSLHQKELSEISRWWKELDAPRKLPFARDRVVEGYFMSLTVYFEPQYALARKLLTKVLGMLSIIDDIYDAYGTYEELEIFTEAFERWSIDCLDQVPEYMKYCFQALLDVFEEIEEEMTKDGRSYRVCYVQESLKILVRAYLVEAKWVHERYIPTMEEKMPNGTSTTGYLNLAITSFIGMGEVVTKNELDWALSNPEIITAAATVSRLRDDIVGHEFEQEREHVASAVECYMKQHGTSEQQAIDELNKQIEDAWKIINQGFLRPSVVPMPCLVRILNLARWMEFMYKEEDGYTHVGEATRNYIKATLIEPLLE